MPLHMNRALFQEVRSSFVILKFDVGHITLYNVNIFVLPCAVFKIPVVNWDIYG